MLGFEAVLMLDVWEVVGDVREESFFETFGDW